ncbi:uncharacterized protein FFNC_13220 [Fusarium fujikuroi]|nr:uncharacterized protein FFE2_08669 [Fusarium fujikuroi]SCO50644.1 uncharacterized protein FFNC_13220 [Fusarium fujikuroi]
MPERVIINIDIKEEKKVY